MKIIVLNESNLEKYRKKYRTKRKPSPAKIKKMREAFKKIREWQKANPALMHKLAKEDSTEIIRKMRGPI